MKERKKSSRQLFYKIINLILDDEVTLTKKQMVKYFTKYYQLTEKPRKKNEL